jgi:pyrroline-5-carboxylate reductase
MASGPQMQELHALLSARVTGLPLSGHATGASTLLNIGVLGVGALTEKVVIGIRQSGFTGKILLSPRNQERAQRLARLWLCEVMAENQSVVDGCALLLLGVRPDAVEQLANEVRLRPEQTLVSLVAGMSLGSLAHHFPTARHVRAMLSYAAQINQSTVVVTPGVSRMRAYCAPLDH